MELYKSPFSGNVKDDLADGWVLTTDGGKGDGFILCTPDMEIDWFDDYKEAGEYVKTYFTSLNSPGSALHCLKWVIGTKIMICSTTKRNLQFCVRNPYDFKLLRLRDTCMICYGLKLNLKGEELRRKMVSPMWTSFEWDRNKHD